MQIFLLVFPMVFLSVYKEFFGALCDASLVILSAILLTVKSPVASAVF